MAIHHMTAKYGGLSGSFSAQLKAFADRTKEQMDNIFRDVVIEVGSRIVRLSPVDTGWFRGAWRLTIDAPSDYVPDANEVDPSGQETIARIVSDAGPLTFGQTAYLVNNLPYGVPLEYGHSRQKAPAGMVRITTADFSRIVAEAVAKNT